ncbi:MAG: tRNA (guanosine(37)-N1)-methyltransferase TrmD [Planctomycetota bacterium]
MLRIDVVTLFPELFPAYLTTSIPAIARRKGAVEYRLHNLRDYTTDVHRSVDDRPFGGGPGMVLKVEPVARCVRAIVAGAPGSTVDGAPGAPVDGAAGAELASGQPAPLVAITSPSGRRFSQALAREWSVLERLVFIAGHYEGHDDRIETVVGAQPVSIGDYVLSGGELPVLTMIDAVVRLLPGVLGASAGADEESFEAWGRSEQGDGSSRRECWLEYPQFTRPARFEGVDVPEILLSGHHEAVGRWRAEQARQRTRSRRPDLLSPPTTEGRPE